MRISDLITVRDAARAVDLGSVTQLLEAVERESPDLTLGTSGTLSDLLGEYVTAETEPVDVLRVILDAVGREEEGGGAFLVRGGRGAGKSHLLAATYLLLQSEAAVSVFTQAHPAYAELCARPLRRRLLVVPIPLSEHRGLDEHLEDIVFDRTEQVLRTPRYNLAVPLSEHSHALDLIERHIVPRYAAELDAYTQQQDAGCPSWEALRRRSPSQAIGAARRFAQQINYPLDFRQSRVERLSRLLEIVREQHVTGIVWLLDDLNQFLSAVGPKAVHGDCSFLEFIGQRCKIAPLYMVATLDEGLEQVTGIEPYLLSAIRASFRSDLVLSAEHMRTVARRRVIGRGDHETHVNAVARVREAFQAAFGDVSFSLDELVECYPVHPTALQCMESIARRFFGSADTLVAFMQDLLGRTTLDGALARDFRRLISTDDVFDYLRPRIASHPEVSAYIYDVLDYYQKNAAEVFPEAPEMCVRLVRALIVLRLANLAAPAPLLAESLGLDAEGEPVADVAMTARALEAMRLAGSFVDIRRGVADGPAVYSVDIHVSVSESIRRRVAAAKGSYSPTDGRLWRRAYAACDETSFPLAQLAECRVLEVQWHNTFRCLAAQLADLATLPPAAISDSVADLADPATVEDASLFVARLPQRTAQERAWRGVCRTTPASRWTAAVMAWFPRELTPQELDTVKEFAAVAELLEDEAAASEAGLREQLVALHGPLVAQVRRIMRAAYYEGDVLSPFGHALTTTELAALAGDWPATLRAVTARAFERAFPDFPAIAPRRPLVSREQVDMLVDRVIRPGSVVLGPDDPLRELIHSYLAPLGLITYREQEYAVDVSRSKVAGEVMTRVRQRDQTPQHEMGRALSCSDLAQHLVKSPLGLPPELFELVVAALIRTGHLAPLRNRSEAVPLHDVATPLSGSVQYVARPPLPAPGQWQVLARVCRTILDFPLPGPDYALQQRVWERLVAAREQCLERVEGLRRRLEAHIAQIEQRPAQWREAFADIEAQENVFRCVRPELHPALGLQEFIADIEPLIGDPQGAPRLSGLFRRVDAIAGYLDKLAPEVVAVRDYLLSPDLNLEHGDDLDARRQAILALIGSGEALISEEMNLRRQVQIFLASYKRAYITWHGRVYRSPVFDQYRTMHQSAEMRALAQLGKLHLNLDNVAEEMAQRVEAQAGRRCSRTDLSDALERSPVCPDCRLRLNEQPELVTVEQLLHEAQEAIRGYAEALASPPCRERLARYAEAAPRRGDLPARLQAILDMGADPSPREILTLFTDDVIAYLNRALSGKRPLPRNLAELRDALSGKTLSPQEAQELFRRWLEGSDEELDDDGLLQIDE